jgi:Xaa-Pro aminopeptidase
MRLLSARILIGAALASGYTAPPPLEGQGPVDLTASGTLAAPAPISAAEFAARRADLAEQMGDGLLFIVGPTSSEAGFVSFAQPHDVRYLTGITEPGVALLMEKRGEALKQTLFVPPRDPAREVWDGARIGVEGARRLTGMPTRPRTELAHALDSLTAEVATLYTVGPPPAPEQLLTDLTLEQQLLSRLAATRPAIRFRSLAQELQRLRAAKSPDELDRIRRAVHITSIAHREAMRATAPGMNEFELHAIIEYSFRRNGAERPGFTSIVGSGPHSTTLHYNSNDRFLEPGDLVVMDIGAAYDGYTADVTRTIPVRGSFSPEQREIYEIVLAAQKAAEARVRPGATWQELNAAAERELASGLARVGLIDSPTATFDGPSGPVNQLRLFYLHGLGHGIGLQVHDPEVSYFGSFQPGGAFTIEPGIYVRPDALDYLEDTPRNRAMAARLGPAVAKYRQIGVRIEDDYIVTGSGVDRISAGAPREVGEIEALMREESGATERQPEVVEWYRSLRGS